MVSGAEALLYIRNYRAHHYECRIYMMAYAESRRQPDGSLHGLSNGAKNKSQLQFIRKEHSVL